MVVVIGAARLEISNSFLFVVPAARPKNAIFERQTTLLYIEEKHCVLRPGSARRSRSVSPFLSLDPCVPRF